MEIEVKDFYRKEELEKYHNENNPFIITTIKLDITPIVEYSRINKNFNALMGYVIGKTANEMEELKYRYKDNKIYYYEKLHTSFTQRDNNKKVCHMFCQIKDTCEEYIKEYNNNLKIFKETNASTFCKDEGLIWYSSTPWFSFTSLVPPFDKEVTIPQFIWDKYEKSEDKYYCHLMIMIDHTFIDGEGIGNLIEKINNNIKNLNL